MSGPGARKALAALVGSECCEPGPHGGNIAEVLAWCEHGHAAVGQCDDDSPLVKDWSPVKVCSNHWQPLATEWETGRHTCSECGHPCALEVRAEWPGGNTTTMRLMPDMDSSTQPGEEAHV